MLVDIYLVLYKLKIVYNYRRRKNSLIPDNLLRHFIEFIPLFSPNAMSWSLSLVTILQLVGYILSNLSTLTTSFSQEQELYPLGELIVVAYKIISVMTHRIRKIMLILNNDPVFHQHLTPDSQYSDSSGE